MEFDYKFRRQFIIKTGSGPEGWISENLSNKQTLFVHKDLGLLKVEKGNRKLILLGFIIDPDSYNDGNLDIIGNLLDNSNDFKSLIDKTLSLSGRWIIIYQDEDGVKLIHDPSGIRQVYYTHDFKIIGSNPSIINSFCQQNLRDDYKFKQYIESKFYNVNEMEWYGNRTFYSNIYKLLPNHYLDITHNNVKRFWINLKKVSYNENINRVCEILVNELKAINIRDYDIIQSLTSGFDSRIILGASLKANTNFRYFISTMNILNQDSSDIKIAKKILEDYNRELEIIDNLEELDEDFLYIYDKNIDNANILPKTLTIQYFYKLNKNYLHISGNASAVFKDYYNKSWVKNGEEISELIGIPKNLTFFNDYFENWIKEVQNFCRNNNMDMMKLFYWENRLPNWGAQYIQEADIAIEEYPPFNNREIFLRLIHASMDKNVSQEMMFNDILKNLDPNLLSYPINPKNNKEKFKSFMKSKLSKRSWEKLKIIFK